MGWTYHWGRAWEEMGNNGFGENFEGGHTFANSKQEVRTPLSKLIWGTMNTKVLISLIVPMPQKLARAAKGWPTRRMTSRCRCAGAHAHMYAHACTCTKHVVHVYVHTYLQMDTHINTQIYTPKLLTGTGCIDTHIYIHTPIDVDAY